MNNLKITQSNLWHCQQALQYLKDKCEYLALMTEEYPVIFEFGGYQFVFESTADILQLREILEERIAAFHAQAA